MTRKRAQLLRSIAGEAKVHYSRLDRFDLACRLGEHFPIAGAEEIAVSDLMYRRGNECYAYVFTLHFRTADHPASQQRVAAVIEPVDRSIAAFEHIALADRHLPLAEQYASLLKRDC